jgi:hypothetical protein
MPMPSVDVVTGIVTNGPIREGEAFRWTCIEFSGNITVAAQLMPDGQPWFSPSPTSFTAPEGSATVTTVSVSPVGGWSWTASGVQVAPRARVMVDAPFPKHAKKAS